MKFSDISLKQGIVTTLLIISLISGVFGLSKIFVLKDVFTIHAEAGQQQIYQMKENFAKKEQMRELQSYYRWLDSNQINQMQFRDIARTPTEKAQAQKRINDIQRKKEQIADQIRILQNK